jgi:hypothetical protein
MVLGRVQQALEPITARLENARGLHWPERSLSVCGVTFCALIR